MHVDVQTAELALDYIRQHFGVGDFKMPDAFVRYPKQGGHELI